MLWNERNSVLQGIRGIKHPAKDPQLERALANPHDAGAPPSLLPPVLQYCGLGIFGALLVFALVCGVTDHWRRATFALGVALTWLAGLRLVCDSRVMGVLGVRSRRFDAAFTTTLGVSMMFVAGTVDSLGG